MFPPAVTMTAARLAALLGAMDPKSLLSRPRLRFCLRVTMSAVLAFTVTQFLAMPLHGLWAVLTAVVVTQMSIGGSLKATADYVIGTIGGAVYASAVAALVPHTTAAATAGALALATAPLAYAAALSPSFRVAPFTAVLVLMISSQLGEGPIPSAFSRLLEVAIGGAVAVAVSLLVFPARANALGLDAAARALEQLARALPQLLAGVCGTIDPLENRRIQDEIGRAVDKFEAIVAEAEGERRVNLMTGPDLATLAPTLLRLRHDLVMLGRAAAAPPPDSFTDRLRPLLECIAIAVQDYLLASADALTSRRSSPPLGPVETAFAAYETEIASIRAAGLMQALSSSQLECIFALGFTLQQFQHDFSELARCVQEWARRQT